MKDRTIHVLLATICVLLTAQFFRSTPVLTYAQAEDAGNVQAILRARTIELVDANGQVRASLKTEPEGEAVFRLLGEKGTIRVKVAASEEGSGLLLIDDRTEPAIHMLANSDGTRITLAEEGKEKKVITP